MDRGAEHREAASEAADRGDAGDTTGPFRFSFRDLDGRLVTDAIPRFRGKVVMVDVFGTWCPTCHDAAPDLVRLYRKYHARGLEIVGLAYEVRRRHGGRRPAGAPLPQQVHHSLSPVARRDQRHRGRGRHAASAGGIHVVPHDDLSGPRRSSPAGPMPDSPARRRAHSTASRIEAFEREIERLLAERKWAARAARNRGKASSYFTTTPGRLRIRVHLEAQPLALEGVPGDAAEEPVPTHLIGPRSLVWSLWPAARPAVSDLVIALVNGGRPPSVGSFSRSCITTRLCGEVESALRQSQVTVHPSGTTTCAPPSRTPARRADGSPGVRVTSSARCTVRAAESAVIQAGRPCATAAALRRARGRGARPARGRYARARRGTLWLGPPADGSLRPHPARVRILTAERRDGGHSDAGADRRRAGVQPLAGAARRAGHPSVDRPGLRVQRLQAAADQGPRHHRSRPRATGSQPSSAGSSPSRSCSWGSPPPCSAAGSSGPVPGRAVCAAACCWARFLVSALGVQPPQHLAALPRVRRPRRLGLGLGYISPVSTLIKWFPDRRGMATGMAIMGFGGGAMIGAPLSRTADGHYATPTSVGVGRHS